MPGAVISVAAETTSEKDLRAATQALRSGQLVIFPTETLYGIAANAADGQAVARLRSLKGAAAGKPFTVHVGDRASAKQYTTGSSAVLRRLARKGWPGPLTIIWEEPRPAEAPAVVTHGATLLDAAFEERLVALRLPEHAVARQLLQNAGVPIVATSANLAGQPAAAEASAIPTALRESVEVVLDAGRTRYAGPSTVVEVRGEQWQITRAGVLDERMVRRMTALAVLFVCSGNTCRSPMAEHLFRRRLSEQAGAAAEAGQAYEVMSAGSFAGVGSPAAADAIRELAARGLDAQGHSSQPLTPELIQRADYIYAMTPEHQAAVLDLVPAAADRTQLLDARAISDPIGHGAEAYARSAAQIEAAVQRRVEEILNEDRDW